MNTRKHMEEVFEDFLVTKVGRMAGGGKHRDTFIKFVAAIPEGSDLSRDQLLLPALLVSQAVQLMMQGKVHDAYLTEAMVVALTYINSC